MFTVNSNYDFNFHCFSNSNMHIRASLIWEIFLFLPCKLVLLSCMWWLHIQLELFWKNSMRSVLSQIDVSCFQFGLVKPIIAFWVLVIEYSPCIGMYLFYHLIWSNSIFAISIQNATTNLKVLVMKRILVVTHLPWIFFAHFTLPLSVTFNW